MMGLAPHVGRNEAHDVVYDACRVVAEKGGRLADALAAMPEVSRHLKLPALERLTDPANYLGAAQQIVDRVVGDSR
jgi:3-carboxy-cis,cis-muconate cycloisomerase